MRGFAKFLLSAIFLTGFLPATALAIDFGGISAQPANPVAGDDRTASWFVYALAPGETKSDSLVVSNHTNESKTIDIYPADSAPTTGNGFALKQAAETMSVVGGWVHLEKNSIVLDPNESAVIPFNITVPANQTNGLWSGGIAVAERTALKNAVSGINLSTRLGVRMYITVVPKTAVSSNVGILVAKISGLVLLAFAFVLSISKIIKMRLKKHSASATPSEKNDKAL